MILDSTGWEAIAAVAAVASLLGASAMSIARAVATRDMARLRDVEEIEDRVHDLREQMASVPTHADLAGVGEKLSEVDATVAAIEASIRVQAEAQSAALKRIEHLVDLLYQQQLGVKRGELS